MGDISHTKQNRLGKASTRTSNQIEDSGMLKPHRHTRTRSTPPKDLVSFADEYRKLAIDCLKVLRVEMQLETIFHMQVCRLHFSHCHFSSTASGVQKTNNICHLFLLMQEMMSREYLEDQDAEEPDDFIISLTAQVGIIISKLWISTIRIKLLLLQKYIYVKVNLPTNFSAALL